MGGVKGSYADFIENADLTAGGGKLNLYTVDQLFTFFAKELSQRNPDLRDRQRQFVNGFYASLDALRKAVQGELFGFQEDERVQVLRTILIYQLCQIPTSLENIQFGLYCLSNPEKNQIKGYLKDMLKNGAVFFRQQSKTYELAASTGEDPYDLIERFVAGHQIASIGHGNSFPGRIRRKASLGIFRSQGIQPALWGGQTLSIPLECEFKSAMIGGFSLRDL